jgi:Magnesium transporter NIPA
LVWMCIGEIGNFVACTLYLLWGVDIDGFAPASIVAPLGTAVILCNALIAPLVFHETFRLCDFMGIVFSTTGAVTIVLSAKTQEEKVPFMRGWVDLVISGSNLGSNHRNPISHLFYYVLRCGYYSCLYLSSSCEEKYYHRPWPHRHLWYLPQDKAD